MLIVMRWIALIFCWLMPDWGWADIYDKKVSLKTIGTMKVNISDGAKDGCWTNLIEAKKYAESKLELAGANVSYGEDDLPIPVAGVRNSFSIAVNGLRMNNGVCVGTIDIKIGGFYFYEAIGTIGFFEFSNRTSTVANSENFNVAVMNNTREAIAEWEARN